MRAAADSAGSRKSASVDAATSVTACAGRHRLVVKLMQSKFGFPIGSTFVPSPSVTLCAFMMEDCARCRSISSSDGDSAFSFSLKTSSCSGVITLPLRRLPPMDTAANGGALHAIDTCCQGPFARESLGRGALCMTEHRPATCFQTTYCTLHPIRIDYDEQPTQLSPPPGHELRAQSFRMLMAAIGHAPHPAVYGVRRLALEV